MRQDSHPSVHYDGRIGVLLIVTLVRPGLFQGTVEPNARVNDSEANSRRLFEALTKLGHR